MFVGCAAYIVAYFAGLNFPIAFAALIVTGSCIYTPTSPNWAWMAEILPRNVVGESMALVNTFGALGGFTGTILVGLLRAHFGSNAAAFAFLAGSFALAGILGSLVPDSGQQEPRGFEVITTSAAAES
jgi:sugar phosphate permease